MGSDYEQQAILSRQRESLDNEGWNDAWHMNTLLNCALEKLQASAHSIESLEGQKAALGSQVRMLQEENGLLRDSNRVLRENASEKMVLREKEISCLKANNKRLRDRCDELTGEVRLVTGEHGLKGKGGDTDG